MKKTTGFTMIEMTIVLIMIGILTATLAPLLLRQFTNSQEDKDRIALEDAKTAIINYAITYGGIPDPVTGNMPSATAFPALGVNNWGMFGDGTTNPFRLDANNNLTLNGVFTAGGAATGDRVVFCQAVNAAMGAATQPSICQDTTTEHYNAATACPAASAVPAAFVLFSTGNDRKPNMENDEAGVIGANRIYENDKRGINNSPGTSTLAAQPHSHYDDQVLSYPLSALARDCKEKMGVLPEVMNCAAGWRYVGSITNSLPASAVAFNVGAAATYASSVPANFTLYVNACRPRTDSLFTSAVPTTTVNGPNTLDGNADGRVDVIIGVSGATYTVTPQ